ncbi:glycosyltransferase family 2 protein [Roseateles sp. LKC17W]|uniref:Glycosyltransferase family 2 protein n=1 Tax=Pelomonas margarita TaxID=3299031 RepID=A0ABW7FG11_9BURK
MAIKLAIIVPCYNEEEVLPETNRRLLEVLTRLQDRGAVTPDSAIHYVDDGSRDKTWPLIEALSKGDGRVHGIKLSRNRGHQAALMSGLLTVPGDALVSIDADLQDDVTVIEKMVDEHAAGAEVVYGVRDSRATDTVFKRNTALAYYGLMRKMGVDLVHNHADFRLMGRRAVEALREYGETNMFLRGIVPLVGYRAATVRYDRAERFAGESKYPLRKMLTFALEGITSFSVVPLRLITLLGLVISVASFLMILFVVYVTLVLQAVVPGWASTVVPIYFLGGIQMLSMGVLGEYVAKIYLETKRRPRFFIEATV